VPENTPVIFRTRSFVSRRVCRVERTGSAAPTVASW